ncbi:SH3 domain-containing protein [Paracoccaceae bacterium]
MFRLTFLLCASLFVALLIGGQDRGQTRFGLQPQPAPQVVAQITLAPAPAEPIAEVVPAAFVPATPVMQPRPTPAPLAEVQAEVPMGRVAVVDARSANLRSGPGTDHEVLARLTRGEEVLVVVEADAPEGWALVRIEGDGAEGYIAARLLRE